MCIKPAPGKSSGWTLAEVTIAMGIGGILVVMLVSFMMYTGFSLAGLANYVDLESQSQSALDRMIQDVRGGGKLTDYATNKIVMTSPTSKVVSYVYDPSARTLTRTVTGEGSTVLLKECDSLNFSIFKRNAYATNLYDLYPTTLSATNCKAVQVRWNCSRHILGSRMNTDTIQSTKIVLRN